MFITEGADQLCAIVNIFTIARPAQFKDAFATLFAQRTRLGTACSENQ
jgi:hypothetical protein